MPDCQVPAVLSGNWGKSIFTSGSELSRRNRSRLILGSAHHRRGARLFLLTELHSPWLNFGYTICEPRAHAMATLVMSWLENHAIFLLHRRNMVCLTISLAIQDNREVMNYG